MGWFDNLVGDIFQGGRQRQEPDHRVQQFRSLQMQRKNTLLSSVVTDRELDEFTRDELLKELTRSNDVGYVAGQNINVLDNVEKVLSEARTSQDEKYVNRRTQSNKAKEKKDRPGLAAQTILTANLGGAINPGSSSGNMKGQVGGSSGTILTKTL